MVELLLGLVIIGFCWIGIAELCRRKLTWPKEHPGATYGISFFLVFLFLAWIGNMDEPEEPAPVLAMREIDPPAPDPAEQGIESTAPDLSEQEIGNPAPDPAERDLENKAQALDQAFKRDRETPAPAKGGLFANLAAGLAKLEAIENMGNPAASEAVERELDPAIADMNCGEMALLLDKVGDEALIARRAYWTAKGKWENEKGQALRYAETDDAAWARIENMEAALPELNRQWDDKFAKAYWVADAMSDKGCCDTGNPLITSCYFAPGPYYANKPLVLSAERRARQEKERREQARRAAIEQKIKQEHGPAIAAMNCGDFHLYKQQAYAPMDAINKARLAAKNAVWDARKQAEKAAVTDEAAWAHIARLEAYAKEQEARYDDHYPAYQWLRYFAIACKENACEGQQPATWGCDKKFPEAWQKSETATWSGEVYQQ